MRRSNQGQAHAEMSVCIQKKNRIIQDMEEIQEELLKENLRLETALRQTQVELKETIQIIEEYLCG